MDWSLVLVSQGIDVVERVPMAVARLGQQLYLVDRNGAVYRFDPAR